ncbi:MAG: hypothetical protein ABI658_13380 [Acidimicrobiales bacterium]
MHTSREVQHVTTDRTGPAVERPRVDSLLRDGDLKPYALEHGIE